MGVVTPSAASIERFGWSVISPFRWRRRGGP
jgi:hypothetical protein